MTFGKSDLSASVQQKQYVSPRSGRGKSLMFTASESFRGMRSIQIPTEIGKLLEL